MQITVVDSNGERQTHAFEEGDNLMQLLTEKGHDEVQALCGGSCSCATCHVHIEPSAVIFAAEENEIDLLELADHYDKKLSRLSCQIELGVDCDGLLVQLLETE